MVLATLVRYGLPIVFFMMLSGMPKPAEAVEKDWLKTNGRQITDLSGNPVWITGLNWFGYNTGTNTFDGLWSVNLKATLGAIADRGFNMLRIPISTQLLHEWSQGIYPRANINEHVNPELRGLNSLEVFDQMLRFAAEAGIKVMMDVHSAKTDAMGHFHPLWYHDHITPEIFSDSWVWFAERYRDDDTILAFDLQNEPHGRYYQEPEWSAIWDDSDHINNWRKVAEDLSNRLLAVNPHILILVEGIETFPKAGAYGSRSEEDYHDNWWGGNLRGVRDFPVKPRVEHQLVYSPHDYGPGVYRQPWFYDGFNKDSLYRDVWRDNWFYIAEDNIAPLLMGEWGGYLRGDDLVWQTALRDFIVEHRIHHTYWCFNANSGDTGGMVDHDFRTWDEGKYNFVLPALWRDEAGRFIGLDHQVPLGKKGVSLGGALK